MMEIIAVCVVILHSLKIGDCVSKIVRETHPDRWKKDDKDER